MLMAEMRNLKSYWAPFLKLLPKEFDTPIFWCDVDLELIRSTPLFHGTIQLKQMLSNFFAKDILPLTQKYQELFGAEPISFELFRWAISTVWNRAYWLDVNDTLPGIVPLADMMNHSPMKGMATHVSGMADYRFHDEQNAFVVTSCYHYQVREEVFTSYGHKDNMSLLGDYGFVLDNLEGSKANVIYLDVSSLLSADLKQDVARIEALQRILQWLSLPGEVLMTTDVPLLNVSENAAQLLALCRLLTFSLEELSLISETNAKELLGFGQFSAEIDLQALALAIKTVQTQPKPMHDLYKSPYHLQQLALSTTSPSPHALLGIKYTTLHHKSLIKILDILEENARALR